MRARPGAASLERGLRTVSSMSGSLASARPLLAHAGATLLMLAALAHGLALTHAKDWPDGPDTFRDIGAAETIQAAIGSSLHRGAPLPDIYYRDEVFWYSPLMPALLAAAAAISHAPMHVVATRLPVLWNLGGPIAFYALAAVLFDPLVAFVALGLFLFVEPFPAREAGTYAPALIASSFAQGFFYAALVAWTYFRRSRHALPAVAAGVLLGASFLAHTAVTALLAAIFVIETLTWLCEPRDTTERIRIATMCALVAGIGVIVALPAMVPLFHYHFQIKEIEPFVYLDPQMGPAHAMDVVRANLSASGVFTTAAALGLAALVAGPASYGRRITLAWFGIALILFVWAAWVVRLTTWAWAVTLTIAPAHHFLIYVRAAESLLGGVGIMAVIRLVPQRTRFAIEWPLAAGVMTVAIGVSLPRYLDRDAHMEQPTFSASQKAAVEWIVNRTEPWSVFLAPENTGVSMIGIVRRKTVLVEPVFSNPYVEREPRFEAWRDMWASLEAGNCSEFVTRADPFDVTHVLLVDGMTPTIHAGACGFRTVFEAPPFTILSRVPDASRGAAPDRPFF